MKKEIEEECEHEALWIATDKKLRLKGEEKVYFCRSCGLRFFCKPE